MTNTKEKKNQNAHIFKQRGNAHLQSIAKVNCVEIAQNQQNCLRWLSHIIIKVLACAAIASTFIIQLQTEKLHAILAVRAAWVQNYAGI